MSIINKTSCVFIASALLCACSSDIFVTHNGNMPTSDRISMVQKGQDKARVRELLGAPSSINPLDSNTWLYMSSDVKRVAFFKIIIYNNNEYQSETMSVTLRAKGDILHKVRLKERIKKKKHIF